jgi:hypothetical protein
MANILSSKAKVRIIISGLSLALWFSFALTASSAEEVTYEGTVQGLNCTYYSKPCPTEDLDIYAALEQDFVLVRPDGKFFLLPNISVLVKARHLTEKVRVRGLRDGTSIWVENLEVQKNGDWETIWNLKKQEEKRLQP